MSTVHHMRILLLTIVFIYLDGDAPVVLYTCITAKKKKKMRDITIKMEQYKLKFFFSTRSLANQYTSSDEHGKIRSRQ